MVVFEKPSFRVCQDSEPPTPEQSIAMTSTDMTTKRLSDRPLESCTELSTEKQFNIILDRLARLTQLQLETQAQISQLAPG
mmetsp:Transcript_73489/g.134461  ORF Transcript_73489/g.134461 Transcript_73489/m.134461 type:complete len:81 (+) Transcript_73489:123-365(+)